MGSAFRVLQAADFSLHQPLEPAGVLPADLREIFNQARERAALKVFHQALSTSVDLLLLTGPLALFEEEPRLGCFLMEQFGRLRAQGVQIVWASQSRGGMPNWSFDGSAVRLQPGESLTLKSLHSSNRMTVAWQSVSQTVPAAHADHLVITLSSSMTGMGFEYSMSRDLPSAKHHAVSIQPDSPFDFGASGMWMVEAISGQIPTTSLLPTAAVNWVSETITIHPGTSQVDLLKEMESRVAIHQSRQSTELTLIQWKIVGQGVLWNQLADDPTGSELLQVLRDMPGMQQRIWSWKIDMQPAESQIDLWRSSSPAFVQAFRDLGELTDADVAAVNNMMLPGHDPAHPGAIAGHPHPLRMRIARASRPATDNVIETR